jgi:hypothetical protein
MILTIFTELAPCLTRRILRLAGLGILEDGCSTAAAVAVGKGVLIAHYSTTPPIQSPSGPDRRGTKHAVSNLQYGSIWNLTKSGTDYALTPPHDTTK